MRQVRVVKIDDHNFGIEELLTYPDVREKDGPGYKKGDPHPKAGQGHWEEIAYYGHRLDWALDRAVMLGMPQGEANEALRSFKASRELIPVIERSA